LHNLLQNNASWNALYVERSLLHLNINIVYRKVLQALSITLTNQCDIFSLDISGPKVVLLCKFSLYWAVRAPIGVRVLRLQPHQPHRCSGPVFSCSLDLCIQQLKSR